MMSKRKSNKRKSATSTEQTVRVSETGVPVRDSNTVESEKVAERAFGCERNVGIRKCECSDPGNRTVCSGGSIVSSPALATPAEMFDSQTFESHGERSRLQLLLT